MKFLMVAAMFGGTLIAQEPAAPAPQQAPGSPGQSNVASTLHVYAYPNQHQTPTQQSKDESDCYNSAQTQAAPSQNAQAGQQGQQQGQSGNAGKGATAKGTAGGAAGGAAIGAIAGDAGTGAAVGAVGGAAVGHRKKKKAKEKAQEQQQEQQQAAQNQATDNVKRAYTACMEARNYTVK
jgi:hypothetical protein